MISKWIHSQKWIHVTKGDTRHTNIKMMKCVRACMWPRKPAPACAPTALPPAPPPMVAFTPYHFVHSVHDSLIKRKRVEYTFVEGCMLQLVYERCTPTSMRIYLYHQPNALYPASAEVYLSFDLCRQDSEDPLMLRVQLQSSFESHSLFKKVWRPILDSLWTHVIAFHLESFPAQSMFLPEHRQRIRVDIPLDCVEHERFEYVFVTERWTTSATPRLINWSTYTRLIRSTFSEISHYTFLPMRERTIHLLYT